MTGQLVGYRPGVPGSYLDADLASLGNYSNADQAYDSGVRLVHAVGVDASLCVAAAALPRLFY